jgi:hypothetical protein
MGVPFIAAVLQWGVVGFLVGLVMIGLEEVRSGQRRNRNQGKDA